MILSACFFGLMAITIRYASRQQHAFEIAFFRSLFGAVFALSWMPCTGPTLGAVLGMAAAGGQTDRAVVLAVAYCLGLGLPFVVFGLGFQRLLGLFRVIRRNSRWVTRVGGALLVLIGLALVTGGWQSFVILLRSTFGVGEVGI